MIVKKYLRKLRFYYWYLKEFITRYGIYLFGSFFVGFLFFKFTTPFFKKVLKPKPILKIGLIGFYSENRLPEEIQNFVSLGLTSLSASGSALPSIATHWEIKNQGKTYIFYLRNDLFWQDGEKFSAKDINYRFKDVEGKAYGNNRYIFTLKESYSPFLTLLSQPLFKKGFIGLGKYKIVRIKKNAGFLKTLILESKDRKIIYKFFPNEEAAISAFKLGELDLLRGISTPSIFKKNKNVIIEPELNINTIITIFFNTERRFLKEKYFRQSLAHAVPYQNIKEVRSLTSLSPSSWAYNEEVKKYNYDLEEAKRLLAKLEIPPSNIKIKITAIRPYDKYLKIIADSWKKLGIKVETQIESVSPYNFNFEALITALEINPDPDQYDYWHSRSKFNISKINSPRIDKTIEDGRKTVDFNLRKENYYNFQKFLLEECPAIFLYFPTVFNIRKK